MTIKANLKKSKFIRERVRSSRTARRQLPARDELEDARRAAPSARRKLPRGRSAPKGRHEAVAAARVIAITPRSRGTCKTSHASLGRQLLARNTTSRSVVRSLARSFAHSFLVRARVSVRDDDEEYIAAAEERDPAEDVRERTREPRRIARIEEKFGAFGTARDAGSTNSN